MDGRTPLFDEVSARFRPAAARHRLSGYDALTEEIPVGDHYDLDGNGVADAAEPREGVPDTGDLVATEGDPIEVDPTPLPILDSQHPDWVDAASNVTPVTEPDHEVTA